MGNAALIHTNAGPMDAYVGDPTAAKGAVVVVQEAFGVTTHIEEVCDRLAAAGFVAVAPSLYHRDQSPVFGYDDMDGAMAEMSTLNADEIDADIDATVDFLGGFGFEPSQVGIIGFCMGGTVAFHTSVRRELGAAVSFYGGGVANSRFGYQSQLNAAQAVRTPWLGVFGDEDASIPVEDVELLRSVVDKVKVPTHIERYPNAGHGFHCNDRPAMYNAEAAADAWTKAADWFNRFLTTN